MAEVESITQLDTTSTFPALIWSSNPLVKAVGDLYYSVGLQSTPVTCISPENSNNTSLKTLPPFSFPLPMIARRENLVLLELVQQELHHEYVTFSYHLPLIPSHPIPILNPESGLIYLHRSLRILYHSRTPIIPHPHSSPPSLTTINIYNPLPKSNKRIIPKALLPLTPSY